MCKAQRLAAIAGLTAALACTSNTTQSNSYGSSVIILSEPTIVGSGTVTLTVSLHDNNGGAVQGAVVQLAAAGLSVVQTNSTTDVNGNATASIVNPTATGQHAVTASVVVGSTATPLSATSSLQVLAPVTTNGNDVAIGTAVNVQAAAVTKGVLNPGYTGTVRFTSSDSRATVPADYTFLAADHGVKLWTGAVTFATPGTQTVTVTDTISGAVLGTETFNVAAQAVGALVWSNLPQSAQAAGTAFNATLTVQDASGNPVTNYVGQVSFSSSDSQAVVPAPVTFTATDAGVVSVPFTLKTAGSQTITASSQSSTSAPGAVTVAAGPAASLRVSAVGDFASGVSGSVQVEALDAYGNISADYRGTVGFTSTESGTANLPEDYTFTSQDAGAHTFASVIFCSTGSATVTATDDNTASIKGTSPSITVGTGTATRLSVVPADSNSNWVAGTAYSVIVSGIDDCANLVPSYTGFGSFTSSDINAVELLQVNFEITTGGQVTVTDPNLYLVTAGMEQLTATDVATNYTGNANINVVPATAAAFRITFGESPGFVAHLNDITVDTVDAFGNFTPNYAGGTVTVQSSDSNTILPGSASISANAGGHIDLGDANFRYYGAQQISVTDGTIHGDANITIHQVQELASHLGWTNCARFDDGSQMKCWSHMSNGEGLNAVVSSLGQSPNDMGPNLPLAQMGTNVSASQIVTGQQHSCLINVSNDANNGKVKCWGYNNDGQLGLGDVLPRGFAETQVGDALPFVDLGAGRTATQLAAGIAHTCAVLDNGNLQCWGYNPDGELGIDNPNSVGSLPGQMGANLTPAILGAGRTAVKVAAGGYHTCALMDDQNVKCWGYNGDGQQGTGNPNRQMGNAAGQMELIAPIDFGGGHKAVDIQAAAFHNCALLDDGSVKCWGYGGHGELGSVPTPYVRVGDPNTALSTFAAVDLGASRTAVQMSLGYQHSCAVLDDGNATCWGYNADGELGLNDPNNRGDGVTNLPIPPINLGTGVKVLEMRAGGYHSCARLSNGTVKCWGYNGDGEAGIGSTLRSIANDPNSDAPFAMGDALPPIKFY